MAGEGEASSHSMDLIRRAEETADKLISTRAGGFRPDFEPPNIRSANAAVNRLAYHYDELKGVFASAFDAARRNAQSLSSDRLQGLAELVQNADDVDASEVRLLLRSHDLLVSHNGLPVRLPHILGFATPWLTTKEHDPVAMGRFGIGLMTLRSLSGMFEVHCNQYHVRCGSPFLEPIDAVELPAWFCEARWTTVRLPLREGTITNADLMNWLDRWSDGALLFLRKVAQVKLLDTSGEAIRVLSVARTAEGGSFDPGGEMGNATRSRIETGDGQAWLVFTKDFDTPRDVHRAYKPTGTTTPVGIALPVQQPGRGRVYAGLPVTPTRLCLSVNAQFDPLANRQDLNDNEWNQSLLPLVAELWSTAVLDLFAHYPEVAWTTIPLPDENDSTSGSALVRALENTLVAAARQHVSALLCFHCAGKGILPLSRLAVEDVPLESILTDAETAGLAELPATLPVEVRDRKGIWRTVLQDWRNSGAELPQPVSVERALELLRDGTRSVSDAIDLVAVGLSENLGERLLELPSIIARDGTRIVPPVGNRLTAVAIELSPLAHELGIVSPLHEAHLAGGKEPQAVLQWLREVNVLLDGSDDRVIVRQLAEAGKSGEQFDEPLTDSQAQTLRRAFELLDDEEQKELGPDVGRVVAFEGYEYRGSNSRSLRRVTVTARAVDAYLPKAIERAKHCFAVAADRSPGIVWINDRYANVLKSTQGRSGIGARKFLALLGAETTPRTRPHPEQSERFVGRPSGLPRYFAGAPAARIEAMTTRGADYTLYDRDSPSLTAAIEHISLDRSKRRRRLRAADLLEALSRSWRRLSEFAEVDAADAYRGWNKRGRIPACWVWQTRDARWLDDESGSPRRPCELRIRTPANVAIYGDDSPDYLHKELAGREWRTVLAVLGVSGDPTQSELVSRLVDLRDDPGLVGSRTERKHETALVYTALARSVVSDLKDDHLRREFSKGEGLVLTELGWRPPEQVLAGPPIFGSHRAFAPSIKGADSLWSTLKLREPSITDCIDVVQKIARRRTNDLANEDEPVLLETLQTLAAQVRKRKTATPGQRQRLARLPLWTTNGWLRERPVYAVEDPLIAPSLLDYVPMWQPGGELGQFRSLLGQLRISEIDSRSAQVIDPDSALEELEGTDLFRAAVQHLRAEMFRNLPELYGRLREPSWDQLGRFSVRVLPSLALRVAVPDGNGEDETRECNVAATVDAKREVLFVRSAYDVQSVDAGRALATLFDRDPRRVALEWREACDLARKGLEAKRLETAEDRAAREREQTESAIADRNAELQNRIAAGTRRKRRHGQRTTNTAPGASRKGKDPGQPDVSRRELVNPDSLELLDPRGRSTEKAANVTPAEGRCPGPAEPTPGVPGPRNRTPVRGYTDLDKESVGLELLRKLLGSDEDEIVDLRGQRGIGADAIDELKNYFELKVHAGPEPDRVTLTRAEAQRASTRGLYLAVVSNVEGKKARPSIRVFVDPLEQLDKSFGGSLTLSGVRNSKARVYDFAPTGHDETK